MCKIISIFYSWHLRFILVVGASRSHDLLLVMSTSSIGSSSIVAIFHLNNYLSVSCAQLEEWFAYFCLIHFLLASWAKIGGWHAFKSFSRYMWILMKSLNSVGFTLDFKSNMEHDMVALNLDSVVVRLSCISSCRRGERDISYKYKIHLVGNDPWIMIHH